MPHARFANRAADRDATLRTIAIVNQKGGCGKTTTAINLAAIYARRGLRTLLVDSDPQSHCAAGLGVPEQRIEYSIGDAMLADISGNFDRSSLVWEVARNLDLAPSTMRLASLEAPGGGLHEMPDKDRRLQLVLEHLSPHYDRCLIDCPPTIGLLTFNALRASREVLIPVETGFFSLKGAQKQWETIQRVIRRIGRPIACHLLATLYDADSVLARDILSSLRRQFAGQILPVVIRDRHELREAASVGQAVIEIAPDSDARRDYESLADWLEDHCVEPSTQIEIVDVERHTRDPDREMSAGQESSCTGGATSDPGDRDYGSRRTDVDLLGGRAAELVERLRRLTIGSIADAGAAESDSETAAIATVAPPEEHSAPVTDPIAEDAAGSSAGVKEEATQKQVATRDDGDTRDKVRHLFGVRYTSKGVLFVQPAELGENVTVAGSFNNWSPTDTPLRYNPQIGVIETLVPIPSGSYQYRIVVSGRWQADQYNEYHVLNEHGEPNSVLVVP